jgi:hypothetical protein
MLPSGSSATISFTLGSNCPWSVTQVPSWVTVTSGQAGKGSGTVAFTAQANGPGPRTGTLTVNGQDIRVFQSGREPDAPPPPTSPSPTPPTSPSPTPPSTSGQDAMLGQWTGTISVNQPCGSGSGNYTWRATITRSGGAYSMALFTNFSFETRPIPVPVLGPDRSFEFQWNDDLIDLILRLRMTFAADWQSVSGSAAGSIICNPSQPAQPLSGTLQGRRTGP